MMIRMLVTMRGIGTTTDHHHAANQRAFGTGRADVDAPRIRKLEQQRHPAEQAY